LAFILATKDKEIRGHLKRMIVIAPADRQTGLAAKA
jgi:hypothetical protein